MITRLWPASGRMPARNIQRPDTHRQSRQRGVVALLITGTLVVVSSAAIIGIGSLERTRHERAQRIDTTSHLSRLTDAIVQYSQRTGRLPCPADGREPLNSAEGSTSVGLAGDGLTCDFDSGGTMAHGVVPWRTLGLRPVDALDHWDNRLSYRVYEGDPANGNAGSLVAENGVNFAACARELGDNIDPADRNCSHNIPRTEEDLNDLLEMQRDPDNAAFSPYLNALNAPFLFDLRDDPRSVDLRFIRQALGTSEGNPPGQLLALGGLDAIIVSLIAQSEEVVEFLADQPDVDPDSVRRANRNVERLFNARQVLQAALAGATAASNGWAGLQSGEITPPGGNLNTALTSELTAFIGSRDTALQATEDAFTHAQNAEYQKLVEWFRNTLLEDLGVRVIVETEDVGALVDDFEPAVPGRGAALVIISHGENQLGAFTLSGERPFDPEQETASTEERVNAMVDSVLYHAIDYVHANDVVTGAPRDDAFDDIVAMYDVQGLAVNAFRYINKDAFDPDQWSETFASVLRGLIGAEGGDTDIIELDEDFAAFLPGGTALTEGEIEIVALPDDTRMINFGAQINVGDPFGPGDEVGLSNDKTGCLWVNQPLRFQNDVLRAYWEFRIYDSIDRANSADGYTFTIIPGDAPTDDNFAPCGNSKIPARFPNMDIVPSNYDPPAWDSGRGGSWPLGRVHKPSGSDLAFIGAKWRYRYDADLNPGNGLQEAWITSRFAYPDPADYPAAEWDFPLDRVGRNLPRAAIEFDTYDSHNYNPRNDPRTGGTSYNHIAVLRENTTIHCDTDGDPTTDDRGGQCGNPDNDYQSYEPDWGTNPWCPDTQAEARALPDGRRGCAPGGISNWMEERDYCNVLMEHCCEADEPCPNLGGTVSGCEPGDPYCINGETVIRSDAPYRVRVEMRRQCDSTCTTCGTPGGRHLQVKAWTDCDHPDCANVLKDFSEGAAALAAGGTAETLNYCMVDPGEDFGDLDILNQVKLGFTIGTGGFRTGMQVTNFTATNSNLRPVFTVPPEFTDPDEFVNLPTFDASSGDPVRIAVMSPESGPDVTITVRDPELSGKNLGAGDYGTTRLTVYRIQALRIVEDPLNPGEDTVVEVPAYSPVAVDQFGFATEGASFGIDGNELRVGGDTIAVFENAGGRLQIDFTNEDGTIVTSDLLNEVLSRITYTNTSADPPDDGIVLLMGFRDGPRVFNQTATVTTPVLIVD